VGSAAGSKRQDARQRGEVVSSARLSRLASTRCRNGYSARRDGEIRLGVRCAETTIPSVCLAPPVSAEPYTGPAAPAEILSRQRSAGIGSTWRIVVVLGAVFDMSADSRVCGGARRGNLRNTSFFSEEAAGRKNMPYRFKGREP
jgi:hypothetical protein